MDDVKKQRKEDQKGNNDPRKPYRAPEVHSRKATEERALVSCDITADQFCPSPG